MLYIKVLCPNCGSDDVVRNGKNSNGKQRVLCRNKECSRKTFQLEYDPYRESGCYRSIGNASCKFRQRITRAHGRLLMRLKEKRQQRIVLQKPLFFDI